MVEVMPVAEFPGQFGWGYDGVALYAVHEPYGGPDGLKRFVDACHARGLGVVMDVVYNHLGPAGNYLGRFGPYFTDKYRTPWGPAVNFDDAGSDEVRRFVVDNALMWLRDYHCDGLRLDAVHAIIDTGAVHVLEQLACEVQELAAEVGRPLWLIAESDLNDTRMVTPREGGGYGLDAQWSDDFHHAVHVNVSGETTGYYADFNSLAVLAKVLKDGFVHDGSYSSFRGRHTLTMGGEYRRIGNNVVSQQDPRGTFTFTGRSGGTRYLLCGGIFASLKTTCLRAFGSYFFISSLLVWVRLFFVVE